MCINGAKEYLKPMLGPCKRNNSIFSLKMFTRAKFSTHMMQLIRTVFDDFHRPD